MDADARFCRSRRSPNNDAGFSTYEALQTAASVADVEAAISKQGIYFVNTIAADRHGSAFYADISSTPHLDMDILTNCRRDVTGLPPQIVILDGSSPECDWRVDPRSTVPGNLPAADMPRATSTRYFTNSNDSYWLSNPDKRLEGYCQRLARKRQRADCAHAPVSYSSMNAWNRATNSKPTISSHSC